MIGARLTAAHLSLQSTVAVLVHETDRIEITVHDSSVELDQVLKDQTTPGISARLHK